MNEKQINKIVSDKQKAFDMLRGIESKGTEALIHNEDCYETLEYICLKIEEFLDKY